MERTETTPESPEKLPTKEFIRECAFDLFREKGYDNVSVANICAKAGISRSAFYYYFKTKSQVMGSLFSDLIPDNLELIKKKQEEEDEWEFLWWFMCLYADRCLALGKNLLAVFMMVSLKDRLQPFLPYDTLRFFNILDETVKKGQKTGRFGNKWLYKYIVSAIRSIYLGVTFDWCNAAEHGDFDYKRAMELELRSLLEVQ
ncbi:MAG: TetR/AcrR family transcriptional regulator [Oscillospiraceae bacterium]|nr:TetR/AcrR family transcriptional regulator [Oscillospiraceae bacterium]